MRLSEFTQQLTNLRRLDEVNMSPSGLKSLASNIDAKAGMEFEMCVPVSLGNPTDIADNFSKFIGRPTVVSAVYHDFRNKRPDAKNKFYLIEPDASIVSINKDEEFVGLEFVSPALPVNELIADLQKIIRWASNFGCYTNETTGLHINISVNGWSNRKGKLDYVKLVLLSGDQHILKQFGRSSNLYCQSALKKIESALKSNVKDVPELFDQLRDELDQLASSMDIDKYTSIHPKNGYVEFRAPGGDWLAICQANSEIIINTLLRYAVALDAAVDPEKYRNEYLKKLYVLLQPKTSSDPLAFYAKYAAGKLTVDQLMNEISKLKALHTPAVLKISKTNPIVGDARNIFGDARNIFGDVTNITGNVSNISGDASKLYGDVSSISGDLRDVYGDVSNIRGDVTSIWGDISNIEGDVSNIEGDVSHFSGDVSNLKGDVSYLRGDVSNIKGDVTKLEGDVSNILGDASDISGFVTSYLEGDVSNISGNVRELEGDVSNLRGDVSNIWGNASKIKGNATGCNGDVTELRGDIRAALKARKTTR